MKILTALISTCLISIAFSFEGFRSPVRVRPVVQALHAKKFHSLDHIDIEKATIPFATALITALPAEAAEPLPSAIVAYSHYLSILVTMGLLVFQRTLLKDGITAEDEQTMGNADLAYLFSSIGLLVSGGLRLGQYGKGFEYYSHEPIFWLKLSFVFVLGSVSLFPTIILLKRNIARKNGEEIAPMSAKLLKRMQSLVNAEITAILSIPLTASLMARGISYNQDFPWQAGAAFASLVLLGAGYSYAKQALTWSEDDFEA